MKWKRAEVFHLSNTLIHPNILKTIYTMQTEITFDIQQAKELRDKGIENAVLHANRVYDGWGDAAFQRFKEFLLDHDEFMTEIFRQWLEDKLPPPPDSRAFGHIVVRAKKEGLIRHLRYEAAKDKKSHRNPKSVWGKII